MPAKLLVIGIDAASPELLTRWAAEGKLPNVRTLLDRGVSGPVNGVAGFYIGSTWPSVYTGLNPANHGFYRIEQIRSGSYGFHRPLDTPDGVAGTPFWRFASDAGRRVAVLDVPLSRIEPRLNGLQTVEWAGHDAVFGFQASSEELARQVLAEAGAHPVPSNCDGTRRSAEDFEPFVDSLEAGARLKGRLTVDLLRREPWDLFVQVFTESHCVGHQCWHIHDAAHPAHDPALRAAVGDPLERVYRSIDAALGEILEHAGDGHVLLFSAHGMGPYRGAQFLFPEILYRLGATLRPGSPEARAAHRRRRLGALAGAGWRLLTGRGGDGSGGGHPGPRIGRHARHSRCFPLVNGAPLGGIRLNLRGREPEGRLNPGAERDAFCAQLAEDLCDIVDERNGRPLVKAVHRTDALHVGGRLDFLPDLLVEWNDELPTGSTKLAGGRGAAVRASSPKIGTVVGGNDYGRTGEHLPTGMFVCAGPGVGHVAAEAVSVMDLAPTICALLGVPAPAADGTVIAPLAQRRA